MNKKTLTVTSVALVLMIVIGIILVFLGSKHGTVYVDGQLARDIHISRWKSSNGTTMNIPLLATLTHLDYKITQQDANIYELKKNKKQFELNLEELSLIEKTGDGMNYISPPPGDFSYILREGNDIVLDMNTLYWALRLMEDEYSVWGISIFKIVFIDKSN